MDRLFCYGTLEFAPVMRRVTGRDFPREMAVLRGYARHPVRGEVYPGIVARAGAEVRGTLYRGVVPAVLDLLDGYESPFYRRRILDIERPTGRVTAWVYVVTDPHLLEDGDWDAEEFARRRLDSYLQALDGPPGAPVRAPRISL